MFWEKFLKPFLKFIIHSYKLLISPFLGNNCRFYPSCSSYALSVLEMYPLLKALKKISIRIIKCNPWNPGGVDLP